MKLRILSSAILLTLMISPQVSFADAPLSPLMKQLNNGNWLPQQEAQSL